MNLLAIHHTTTKQSTSPKRFGFYNIIIGAKDTHTRNETLHDRGNGVMTLDVALVGNFLKDKPTPYQINELKRIIELYKYKVVEHKDLKSFGALRWKLATKCPGRLMDYVNMLRVIKVKGHNDQFVVSGGRKFLIPDAKTLMWLRDELEIINPVENVSQAEFDSFETGNAFASQALSKKLEEIYPVIEDAFGGK
jgi:hypothetical protein|tara:strand:+ start:1134 stop:1715 length:582 start_codon:yes stop_codon:yes gene_type:complete